MCVVCISRICSCPWAHLFSHHLVHPLVYASIHLLVHASVQPSVCTSLCLMRLMSWIHGYAHLMQFIQWEQPPIMKSEQINSTPMRYFRWNNSFPSINLLFLMHRCASIGWWSRCQGWVRTTYLAPMKRAAIWITSTVPIRVCHAQTDMPDLGAHILWCLCDLCLSQCFCLSNAGIGSLRGDSSYSVIFREHTTNIRVVWNVHRHLTWMLCPFS